MRITTGVSRTVFVIALGAVTTLSVLAGTASANAATEDAPTTSGRVLTDWGEPIPNVAVYATYIEYEDAPEEPPPPLGYTAEDGTFTINAPAVAIQGISYEKRGWFTTTVPNPTSIDGQNLAPVVLSPAGYVRYTLASKAAKPITAKLISLSVDGCDQPLANFSAVGSACPTTLARYASDDSVASIDQPAASGGPWELSLTPGHHTLRFEVKSPLANTTRDITRQVTIADSDYKSPSMGVFSSIEGGILEFKADPTTHAKVASTTFRRHHRSTVVVQLPKYTDSASPKLRTTLRINGDPVKGSRVSYTTTSEGDRQAVVRVPGRYASAAKLHVRAIVHGNSDYSGVTSRTVTLVTAAAH